MKRAGTRLKLINTPSLRCFLDGGGTAASPLAILPSASLSSSAEATNRMGDVVWESPSCRIALASSACCSSVVRVDDFFRLLGSTCSDALHFVPHSPSSYTLNHAIRTAPSVHHSMHVNKINHVQSHRAGWKTIMRIPVVWGTASCIWAIAPPIAVPAGASRHLQPPWVRAPVAYGHCPRAA